MILWNKQGIKIDTEVQDGIFLGNIDGRTITMNPKTYEDLKMQLKEEIAAEMREGAGAGISPEAQATIDRVLIAVGIKKVSLSESLKDLLPIELLRQELLKENYLLARLKKSECI